MAGAMLVLSLLVTYTLWNNAQTQAARFLQAEFDFRARETSVQIKERMAAYEQVLRGAQGFLLGSLDVTREEFRRYVAALRVEEHYPGIQGIAISEIVPPSRIDEHVAAIRREGFPHYTLHPSGERDLYTAITKIEPFNAMNQRAFGFDMYSEPVRRAAMQRSRDTGQAALSGKVTLVQEAPHNAQAGFLMYLPVYKRGMPLTTEQERRAAILGWAYAPFRINDFMAGLGGQRSEDLHITIYDGEQASSKNCLFGCTDLQSDSSLFKTALPLNLAGQPWTLEIRSTPAFANRLDSSRAQWIAVMGVLISALLAFLVWLLASGRSRALALAQRMTKELRTSEFRWKYALEGAGDGVWDWDLTANTVLYSRRWKEMLGFMEQELSSEVTEWEKRLHPQDKPGTMAALHAYIDGKNPTFAHECRMQCKDGDWIWVLTRGSAVSRDSNGKPLRIIGTHTDITERKEAEQREKQRQQALEEARAALARSQKLEAVGKLTGGVAHDFNNALQIISGNIQLLLATETENSQKKERLQTALHAVERGAKLSSQLLSFARRQPLQPRTVNLRKVVGNMDDLLRRALGEAIEIETVVAGGLWNTQADPNQLENVILNLAINARDAMKDGGKLTIELGNAMLDDEYVLSQPDVPAGQYVVLAISDTGSGMPAQVLEHAFEPFFTTKPEGEGTGLGLSMAYGFVKQSGGHIQLYSEVGHGTTVRIYLPRSFEAEQETPPITELPVIGGTETILIVEDDIHVQRTVFGMLKELGYNVLAANDAESALEILKSDVKIDLLFTDVVMPGKVRTPDMARQAKALHPELTVLFTSGYTQNAIVHGGRLDPGVELLSKPYRREQLARKIRHVLANQEQKSLSKTELQAADLQSVTCETRACRILVVEDNEDLCVLACELLTLLGHHPYGVKTAEEALTVLQQHRYDVLLTDIGLPGMSGLELAERVAAFDRNIKIIFSTGMGKHHLADPQVNAITLTKPYTVDKLMDALR